MEHIKLFWSRLNIPTLLQACKENQHWSEAVFLYSHYDQFDMAVDTLIAHSTGMTGRSVYMALVARCAVWRLLCVEWRFQSQTMINNHANSESFLGKTYFSKTTDVFEKLCVALLCFVDMTCIYPVVLSVSC